MASTEQTQIGFIGLGAMGKPMATNLAKHFTKTLNPVFKLHIYDIVSAPLDDLYSSFPNLIIKCTSPRDVASKSTVIFTMLPSSPQVQSVYLDPSTGIISSSSSPPLLLIDCSTISPSTHLSIKSHFPLSTTFYDAPVSGGVLGAISATIAIFLGCAPSDPLLPLLHTLLSPMASQIIPCGGPSLGLAAKLSNNYLSGTITIACAEAMDMGIRAGIHPFTLQKVFSAGTAQNRISDVFNPVPGVCPDAPSSKGYKGGFRVQLMRKDIGLAVDMARTVGAMNVLGVSTLGVYAAASEATDCKDLDSRVVYRFLGGMENVNEWPKVKEEDGVD
ncbi:6-phosphogluconate dehydrogenase [Podospora fimiseda]|uniref:3-hydroxyisobutyrate dehydrogenase n=1 Tax=Podospora fimiseda TaxID=252190 RepID=A0AAN7BWK7_9PEZI|nr:6-phosphogluconate dehydrogenase [Podospora fimiseda]